MYKPYILREIGEVRELHPLHILGAGTISGANRSESANFFHFNLLKFDFNEDGEYSYLTAIPHTLALDSLSWKYGDAVSLNLK